MEDSFEEKLEISLGYEDFISGLNKVVNNYNSTLKSINTINTTIGKSFDNFRNQVVSSLDSMTDAVVKRTEQSVMKTSAVTNKALDSIKLFRDDAVRSLEDIGNKTKALVIEQEKLNKTIKKTQDSIVAGKLSQGSGESIIKDQTQMRLSNVEKLKSGILKSEQEHYDATSRMSSVAMNSLVTTSEASTKAIGNAVGALSVGLVKSRRVVEDTGQEIENIIKTKGSSKAVLEQQKIINAQVENLGKDRQKAEEIFNASRIAHNLQTDEVLKSSAYKVFKDNEANLERVNKAYERATAIRNKLVEQMATTEQKVNEKISKARENLGAFEGIKGGADVRLKAVKTLIESMTQDLGNLGTKGTQGISNLTEIFRDLEVKLKADIGGMKELNSLMKSLGTVDVKSKQLLPGMEGTTSELVKFTNQYRSSIELINRLALTGPLTGASEKYRVFADKIKSNLQSVESNIQSFKKISNFDSVFNIEQGHKYWSGLKSANEDYVNTSKSLDKQLSDAQKSHIDLILQAEKNAGNEKESIYRSYANNVAMHILKIKKAQEETNLQAKSANDKQFYMYEKLINASKQYSERVMRQAEEWGMVKGLQNQFSQVYEQITASSTRMTRAGKEDTKVLADQFRYLRDTMILYEEELTKSINGLKAITKKGIFDHTIEIEALEKIKRHYDAFGTTLKTNSAGVEKMVRAQAQAVEQAWHKTAWNTVRNFRWQYAALYYLAIQFANFIKNSFISILDDISKFRMSVYAYAGTVGLNMGKEFAGSYNLIYEYSKNLMEKLQAKAAESYASLEDLQMVVKSFAQHGVFPRTDKDVENINTIATAVKIMTEGMANSGTQMRQEVMALIEGRTRITDSVARALKTTTGDLTKKMQEWAATGKSRLEGFAELLSAFAEVNKHITSEYTVQVKRLATMWDYLKRIAGEELTLQIAKDLKEFIDSLGKPGEALTKSGKEVVMMVKTYLVSLYEILKIFGQIAQNVFDLLSSFGGLIATINGSLDHTTQLTTYWGKTLEGVLQTFTFIKLIVGSIALTFTSIIDFVTGLIDYVKAFGTTLGGILTFNTKLISEGIKLAEEAQAKWIKPFNDYAKIVNDYNTGMTNAHDLAVKLEQTTGKIKDNHEDALTALLGQVSLNAQIATYNTEVDKIKDKYKPKEEKAADNIKFVKDWTSGVVEAINIQNKALDEQKDKLQKGLDATEVTNKNKTLFENTSNDIAKTIQTDITNTKTSWISFLGEVGVWVEDTDRKIKTTASSVKLPKATSVYPEYNNDLGAIANQNEARRLAAKKLEAIDKQREENINKINDARNKEKETIDAINEKLTKGQKTQIDYLKQAYDLLERLGGINPFEKIRLEKESNLADIDKEAQKNKIVSDYIGMYKAAANKKYWSEYMELQSQANDKAMDLQRKITGQEQGGISKITEEYRNYGREIEKTYLAGQLGEGQLNEKVREHLTSLLAVNEALAKRRYLNEVNRELQSSYLDVAEAQAKYLSESSNTSDKQLAQLITEQVSFERAKIENIKAIQDVQKEYGKYPEVVAAMTKNLNDGLQIQAQLLEKHKDEVMNPFWTDMKKMSEQWADSFADSMADVFMGTKDLAEAMDDLLKSTFKDIVKSFIKNQFVNPMMDQLNGSDQSKVGATGGLSGIFSMFSGAKEKTKGLFDEITVGTPLPVMVTNMAGMAQGFSGMGMNNMGGGSNIIQDFINEQKSVSTPKNLESKEWLSFLKTESEKKKLDYSVMMSLINQESSGNPNAKGSIGERGLMQLTPGAVSDVGGNFSEMYDPYKNITAGTDYFRKKLDENKGDYYDALRSYNAGFGGAMKNPNAGADYAKSIMEKSNQSFDTITSNFKQVSDNANQGFDTTFNSFDTTLKKFDSSSVLTTDYLNQNKNNVLNQNQSQNLLTQSGLTSTNPIPVIVTNLNGMGNMMGNVTGNNTGGMGSLFGQNNNQQSSSEIQQGATGQEFNKDQATAGMSGMSKMLYNVGFTIGKVIGSIIDIVSGIFNTIKTLFSSIGNMFSGLGGGGGGGGLFSLFSSGSSGGSGGFSTANIPNPPIGMREGGTISEPIFGVGLRSSKTYTFGENGSVEDVVPRGRSNRGKSNVINDSMNHPTTQVYFNVQMNSIDSRSGVDFLIANAPVFEGMMAKALKNNKGIRKNIRDAY